MFICKAYFTLLARTAPTDARAIHSSNASFRRDRAHRKARNAFIQRVFWSTLCLILACPPLYSDSISVSGDPGPLVINGAIAGSEPTSVTDATTTYSVQTTPNNQRITGELNSAMPANTTLRIELQPPTGATGMGEVSLSTTAQNLVTSIPHHTDEGGLSITYKFCATVSAGIVSPTSRTVTLTVTSF